MVEVCAPLVAVLKPQAAFFERHGPDGMAVLCETVAAIHERGALALIDVKRGDIGSTAVGYGEAFLGPNSPFRGDAITVNPYLGFGSLTPIIDIARRSGTGVFVVVRSSNPEGTQLQRAETTGGRSVAECLALDIAAANGAEPLGPIGAVVGATLADEAALLAAAMPNALLLVPGVGAQGATIADVRREFGPHYGRVIPSVSRGISRAGPDPGALADRVKRYIAEARVTA
jgi:orotidine-5'-phosphate decarboxylase